MLCSYCGEPIEYNEPYYEINNEPVCIQCGMDFVTDNCERIEDGFIINHEEVFEDDVCDFLTEECMRYNDDDPTYNPYDEPEFWKDR